MMFKYMCLVLFVTWYQLAADCHPAKSNLQSIDTMIEKESEAFLSVEAEDSSHKTVRDKRTVGFLRQLFPNLSQIVDRKIQQVTRFLFRVIGRLVLRGGAGGGAGNGAGAGGGAGTGGGDTGGRRISITLPTFPPSEDDENEDQTEVPTAAPVESRADASPSDAAPSDASPSDAVSPTSPAAADSVPAASADLAASTDPTADVVVTTVAAPSSTTTIATTTVAAANVPAVTTSAPATQSPSESDNTVGTSIVKRTVREVSTEESKTAKKRSPLTDTENDVPSDNTLSNTSDDDKTDEDSRNKRFSFNLRGGGGGGSGNFLFDLIRRGADRAARAAGGFYRVVAGTDPNTLTLAQPLQYPSLIAGSGANQDKDESNIAPIEGEASEIQEEINGKEDGYSVGVPGPLTRIFVIANRGVANLVQDLILRLAQTTERIVNFKARLITSLI